MPQWGDKSFDDILEQTKNYRCQYLDILIEKYVKNQDDSVEIHLQNFSVKSTKYLKRVEVKPFGYVSSYECKVAKKSVNDLKKKIISEKRASFRKYAGIESFAENFGGKIKHLTPAKIYKALMAMQKSATSEDEAESILSNETTLENDQTFAENTLINETVLDGDQTFTEDDESTLINEMKLDSDRTFDEENALSLATNNDQKISNYEVKNCFVNLVKCDDLKQLDTLLNKIPAVFNDVHDDKTTRVVSQKLSVRFKDISSPKYRENGSSIYNSGTSFIDYVASKVTPKFRFKDIGLGISKATSNFSAISSTYASNKSIESPKLRYLKDRMLTYNNSYQTSNECNYKSLLYDSNKSSEPTKLKCREVEMEISNKNIFPSNDYSAKALLVAKKSVEISKLSSSNIRIENSSKKYTFSSADTPKSLSCDLNMSTDAYKLESKEDKMNPPHKNCQTSSKYDDKSFSCISNKSTELSKFSFSKIDVESSNKNCKSSNSYAGEFVSHDLSMSSQTPKLRSGEQKTVTANKNCLPSVDCNATTASYASKNLTETPKLRPRETSQPSSACKAKSFIYAPHESAEPLEHRHSETGAKTSNRNCQTPLTSFSSKNVSLTSNPETFVEIDSLSLRKGSSHKKQNKNKSLLTQSTLPFQKRKSYINNSEDLKIDDLSFRKTSTPKKTPKNK